MILQKPEIVKLKQIQKFDDLTHVDFEVSVLDESGDLIEGGTLTVVLSGDIRSKSLSDIEKLARVRLKTVVEQLKSEI